MAEAQRETSVGSASVEPAEPAAQQAPGKPAPVRPPPLPPPLSAVPLSLDYAGPRRPNAEASGARDASAAAFGLFVVSIPMLGFAAVLSLIGAAWPGFGCAVLFALLALTYIRREWWRIRRARGADRMVGMVGVAGLITMLVLFSLVWALALFVWG